MDIILNQSICNSKCFFSQNRTAGSDIHVIRMADVDLKQYPSDVTPRRAQEKMAVPDIVEIQFRKE